MDDDDVAVQGLYYGSLPARDVKNAWEWTLDALGNWGGYREKANGEGTPWDLDQTRLSNKVNEIDNDDNHANTPSGSISGGSLILPVYDHAGNMAEGPSAPRPADWTTAEQTKHKYVYDAWNRLVKVTDNSNATIALYRYDGLGRRIARLLPNGETWDRTDYYYDESWQVLEERFAGGVSDANKDTQTTVDGAAARVQWLWDVRYIDAPVLRWRDTNADGTLDETLYYCNDANMNATALVGTSGTVVERYLYDPYGKVSVYDGSWSAVTWANSKQNEVLYCGYRFDAEGGLYCCRARYYHATLGRWGQRDPDGYTDGIVLYEYGRGNPASYADPSGTAVNCQVKVRQVEIDKTKKGFPKWGHTWISMPGLLTSIGFHPVDENQPLLTTGKVESPDKYEDWKPNRTWSTSESQSSWRALEAGKYKNLPCVCTNCDDIYDCIDKVGRDWEGTPYSLLCRNCRHFVSEVLRKCCLHLGAQE